MIQINFDFNLPDQIQKVTVTGHAGYADAGYDIVCAAVSSQVISVENSLQHILHYPVQVQVNESEGGYLSIQLDDSHSKNQTQASQLLMQHLHLALSVIAESYPEFVQVKDNYKY
ncbi:ribosomal-processing cysteine protease Prp [Hutsoniella sourekii]